MNELVTKYKTTLYGATVDLNMLDDMMGKSEDSKNDVVLLALQNEVHRMVQHKVDDVVAYDSSLSDLMDIIEKHMLQLEQLHTLIKKKRMRFSDYVKAAMDNLGVTELRGILRRLVIPKPRKTVYVFNASELPAAYVRVKRTEEPDKIALYDALKAGVIIPGAQLVDSKQRVNFKLIN